MTLLEEIHGRHRNFHRVIARKADAIAPKPAAVTRSVGTPIDSQKYYHCMWFYNLVQEITPLPLTVRSIRDFTAKYYGITTNDIVCERRTKTLVRARQVAMYLCRELTPHSLPAICRHFGDRDHTTALYAARKIERLMQTDEKLAEDIRVITSKFPKVNS